MCRRYGYSKLTPAVKDKILGGNAARVYGIDLDAIRPAVMSDDLAWAKLLLEDYRKNGFAALR